MQPSLSYGLVSIWRMNNYVKIDKELIKKTYTREQLEHMLTETNAVIMKHSEEIVRLRRQQEELVKNACVIAEVIAEVLVASVAPHTHSGCEMHDRSFHKNIPDDARCNHCR